MELAEHVVVVGTVSVEVSIDRVRGQHDAVTRDESGNEIADFLVAPEDVAEVMEEYVRGAGEPARNQRALNVLLSCDPPRLVVFGQGRVVEDSASIRRPGGR